MPHPYPDGAAEQWIAGHAETFREGSGLRLAVTVKPGGRVVGTMGLDVSRRHARAELTYMVARECWGRGYATEAARAVVRYGFEVLGLQRIQATHFPDNPASGRVMEKLGMSREGVLRQYVRRRGVPADLVLYSLLRGEFEGRRGDA
jgi:RimJ/RimL family protein N-acetyltransferase